MVFISNIYFYTPKTYVIINSNLNKSCVGPIYESSVFKIYFEFLSFSKIKVLIFKFLLIHSLCIYLRHSETPSDAN